MLKLLVAEHAVMKEKLGAIRTAAGAGDFSEASRLLRELDAVFRQHIADEEAQILSMLVARLGVEGAKEEIRVFQQHRPIYALMTSASSMAAMGSSELRANSGRLLELLDAHSSAEEGSVFPKALKCSRSG